MEDNTISDVRIETTQAYADASAAYVFESTQNPFKQSKTTVHVNARGLLSIAHSQALGIDSDEEDTEQAERPQEAPPALRREYVRAIPGQSHEEQCDEGVSTFVYEAPDSYRACGVEIPDRSSTRSGRSRFWSARPSHR